MAKRRCASGRCPTPSWPPRPSRRGDFPAELFRSRAELATPGDLTYSNRRARDALPAGGTVLDVGVGAGAASLPLRPRCSLITGVDSSAQQARRVPTLRRAVAASRFGPSTGDGRPCRTRAPRRRRRGLQPRRVQRRRPRALRPGAVDPRSPAGCHGDHQPASDRVDGRPVVAISRAASPGSTRRERRRLRAPRPRP